MSLDELVPPGLPRVATALHGPAHPEEFRTQVGRFRERFYFDPLSADERWSTTDETWPAISTIKKAAGKDWSWTSLQRCAAYLVDKRHELDGMTADEIHARLNEVNKAGLNRAANRGTSLHNIIEARLAGQPMLPGLVPEVEPYLPVVDKMLAELQPTLRYAEVVAINREHGYGGTLDAVVDMGGKCWLVDWKSRSGRHGAYEEEGWQAAAYQRANYWIVEEGGQPCRIEPPNVDGLLIVSLTTESYRLYPIDADVAWDGFMALLRLWKEKRYNPIGKPIKLSAPGSAVADVPQASPATSAPEPTPARPWDELAQRRLRATEIKERGMGAAADLLQLWPVRADGSLPSLLAPGDITPEEWEAIDKALTAIEQENGLYVTDAERATLKAQHDAMPSDLRAEFAAWYASTGWSGAHRMTRGQANATIEVLHPLHVRAAERRAQVTRHLAMVDATTAEAVIRLCVRPERVEVVLADVGQVLELEAEAIGCVVDAVAEGFIFFGMKGWTVEHGLPHKGLRDAARPIAERYDLPLPKSAADVVGSPLLAALTWGAM